MGSEALCSSDTRLRITALESLPWHWLQETHGRTASDLKSMWWGLDDFDTGVLKFTAKFRS